MSSGVGRVSLTKRAARLWRGGKASTKGSDLHLLVGSADAARDARDWSEAARLYAAVLSIDPARAGLEVQYGHVLKEAARFEEAVDAYKRGAAISPEDPDPLLHLAHLLKNLDRRDEAVAIFQQRQNLVDDDSVRVELEALGVIPEYRGAVYPSWMSYDYSVVEKSIDIKYYLSQFGEDNLPEDPVFHYLDSGWRSGLDPCEWFSTKFYIESNLDVAEAGINPFVHYLSEGVREGRSPAMTRLGDVSVYNVYKEHSTFTSSGIMYEDVNRKIVAGKFKKAKVLAYYLPQFHAIPENDAWWGKGFTEWRNIVRGLPRFHGHYQPRVPRDLGFYDLSDDVALRRQAEMAAAAGIFGFCFYYYSFNGKRLLSKPTETLLSSPDIKFPFCIMWANENWTKTWDGLDRHVLLSQDYRREDEDKLIDDLARHFEDERYIKIDGRPLFFIYRPGIIPDAPKTIARWRRLFEKRHDLKPLFYMAQGFGDTDPGLFGMDGAIEFPPHKLAADLPAMNERLEVLDPEFKGHVVSYDDVIERSLNEPTPAYPLIKTATPSWDNEARRPGRGMLLHGSTPAKFEAWMKRLVQNAVDNPVHGESFVAVNAWNEWAEGAYLEPDVHYGGAYLNAVARAVVGARSKAPREHRPILIVGHDAYPHGAQMLVRNLGRVISEQFGCEVSFLICGEGPLLADYKAIGNCMTVARHDVVELEARVAALWARGVREVIVNTTVSGWVVPVLKRRGFSVTCLIHELATLIGEYGLAADAEAIARNADVVVFPAIEVRDSFALVSGPINGQVVIRPQGLYRTDLLNLKGSRSALRKRRNIPKNAKVVINVGYADARKGFDLFLQAAYRACAARDDIYFLWVGDGTVDVKEWQMADVRSGPFKDRILLTGFVDNVEDYYIIADTLFLTSREDPFPSVILEAFAVGLPVLAFEGSGGCVSLVSSYGRVVDRNNAKQIDAALLDLMGKANNGERDRRRELVRRDFMFDAYAHDLLRLGDKKLASVSVVVPSYNYARYMSDRLETVFDQTYPILETIVLDDRSTDGSPEMAIETSERVSRSINLIVNEVNSGNVFRQWRLAAEQARGDYLWISEADDVADPMFLENLVDAMEASGAVFGFTDSWQIDSDGDRLGDSYRAYVNEIEAGAFDHSFSMDGLVFLKKFLSIKNVVLNVSGVLWRRSALLEAMDAIGSELFEYAVAGDWRLYAQACQLGAVVYEATPLNGHRRHMTSVTHALAAQRHYDEVVKMQEYVALHVTVDDGLEDQQRRHREAVRRSLKLAAADDASS